MRLYRLILRWLVPHVWWAHREELEEMAREAVDQARARGRAAALGTELALARDALRVSRRTLMEGVMHDLRYALRGLSASKGFTVAAVLSIGLAIGANTTIFSLVHALLINPLPLPDAGRVVAVFRTFQPQASGQAAAGLLPVSYPNYEDLRAQTTSLSALAAYSFTQVNLSGGDEPARVAATIAGAGYFEAFGITPLTGRFFTADEAGDTGAHRVTVLSERLWRTSYGADRGIIGRTIHLNGLAFTVVGVAPRGFHGALALFASDIWVPMSVYPDLASAMFRQALGQRAFRAFLMVGRLAPDATVASAQAELAAAAEGLAAAFPEVNRGRGVRVMPIADAATDPNQQALLSRGGVMLMGAVALVLVIACVNLSNLLLVRTWRRRRERAVRLALGASRYRLVRQQLVESLVISALGGAAGLLLARWARELIWRHRPPAFEQAAFDLTLNVPVLVFTIGITLVAGLAFGLVPALQAGSSDLISDLRQRQAGGLVRGRRWRGFDLRDALLALQVALCVVAIAGAGAFARSLQAARAIDPGFDHARLGIMSFDAASPARGEDALPAFFERVVDTASGVPGVRAAALADTRPLGAGRAYRLFADGADLGPMGVYVPFNAITPEYFDTVGIGLIGGRGLTRFDTAGSRPVAVVNDTLARRFWPGGDALGRRLRLAPPLGTEIEIVGVVETAKYVSLGEEPSPYMYLPLTQAPATAVTLHVSTPLPPASVIDDVRLAVRQLDAGLPIVDVREVSAAIDDTLWAPAMIALLLGVFGLVAAVLAVTGIYAMVGQLFNQRRHELGVRMALGGRPVDAMRFIARKGLAPVVAGLLIGTGAAALLLPSVGALLYGAQASLPVATASAGVMGVAAIAATAVPLRRVLRLDPLSALSAD